MIVRGLTMGLFGNKKKQDVKLILPDHAKCSRCGRKIKRGSNLTISTENFIVRNAAGQSATGIFWSCLLCSMMTET